MDIKAIIQPLKRQGWKVKFEYEVVEGIDGDEKVVVKFRANKKHINLRGHIARPRRYNWQTQVALTLPFKWVYEIFRRNENGGYNKCRQDEDVKSLEEYIAKADEYALAEEPTIPTWKRDELPQAFKLPDGGNSWHTKSTARVCENPRTKNRKWVHKNKMAYQNLVLDITCLNIVSIAHNCMVSIEAAITPGNRAWFMLDCDGTEGSFLIITDGDEFYPVKKMPSDGPDTYKIQLALKQPRVDLNEMNSLDSRRIRKAVEYFANEFADQFAQET